MTYTIIKTENYDTEIGEVETIDEAVQAIKDFNQKCKYPLDLTFEPDLEDDGLDAFGVSGRRLVTFHTVKKCAA